MKKSYARQDFFPYPFDRNITMVPFPPRFEIPKFDYYKGKGNHEDHIREFHVHYMEVAYENSYLMWLFPRSLVGLTIEWFARLPPRIKKFQDIIDLFIENFSFNLDMDVNLEELFGLK